MNDVCENKQESRLNVLDRNFIAVDDDNIKSLEPTDMKGPQGLLEIKNSGHYSRERFP